MISNLIKTSLSDAASASACFIVRRDVGALAVLFGIVFFNDLGGSVHGDECDAQHLVNIADGINSTFAFTASSTSSKSGTLALGIMTVFTPRM